MADAAAWLAALALATPFAVGAASGEEPPHGAPAFAFTDPEIVESSGLAVLPDGLVATVNDSGDTGRVFVVEQGTGDTVGVTSWAEDPYDVEALAPAGPGAVWVGDIGDNRRSRDAVSVARVPVGRGERSVEAQSYELVYPDGPRDAEALLAHPATGQLFVVSKVVFGGQLYAAPRELDPGAPNGLTSVGPVVGIVTDGAFLPDGRHLVLRTYTTAHVLTFPGLEEVAEVELPEQAQGEGIAVLSDDEVLVSTEGQFTDVLRVELPGTAPEPAAGRGDPPPDPPPAPAHASRGEAGEQALERDPWRWLLVGAGMLVGIGVLVRSLRPR